MYNIVPRPTTKCIIQRDVDKITTDKLQQNTKNWLNMVIPQQSGGQDMVLSLLGPGSNPDWERKSYKALYMTKNE